MQPGIIGHQRRRAPQPRQTFLGYPGLSQCDPEHGFSGGVVPFARKHMAISRNRLGEAPGAMVVESRLESCLESHGLCYTTARDLVCNTVQGPTQPISVAIPSPTNPAAATRRIQAIGNRLADLSPSTTAGTLTRRRPRLVPSVTANRD